MASEIKPSIKTHSYEFTIPGVQDYLSDISQIAEEAYILRDLNDDIIDWCGCAEKLYGWEKNETLGLNAIELLRSKFQGKYKNIKDELLINRQWKGIVEQKTKDGVNIVVLSNWILLDVNRMSKKLILNIDRPIHEEYPSLNNNSEQYKNKISDQNTQILKLLAEGTAASTGMDFFHSMVKHLAAALKVRYAFVAQCTDRTLTRVKTLAYWMDNDFCDNVEFSTIGTPCENVMAGELCMYPNHLQELFPKDTPLVDMGAHSYIGVPIFDNWNNKTIFQCNCNT